MDSSDNRKLSQGGADDKITSGCQVNGDGESPFNVVYSMPGILHYLQTEWAKMELERAEREVEKAELQARVSFLQGERKGQDNLRRDLVRRIRMLEFALRKERNKYNALKHDSEVHKEEKRASSFSEEPDYQAQTATHTWNQGRKLLRQYLQEIGYTDTIIDVRSSRVRAMLGLQPRLGKDDESGSNKSATELDKDKVESSGTSVKDIGKLETDADARDTENAMASMDFLSDHLVPVKDESVGDTTEDGEMWASRVVCSGDDGEIDDEDDNYVGGLDAGAEEVLSEFDIIVAENDVSHDTQKNSNNWDMDSKVLQRLKDQYTEDRKRKRFPVTNLPHAHQLSRPKRGAMEEFMQSLRNHKEPEDGCLNPADTTKESDEQTDALATFGFDEPSENDLGELASLNVEHRTTSRPARQVERETVTPWCPHYTLRSHFDAVRSVVFHPVEPLVVTGSEDHTLKLWNLKKTITVKKMSCLDVEPVYTFRGHTAPVISVCLDSSGEKFFSAGVDGTIRGWALPSADVDPYDLYDPAVSYGVMGTHDDIIWSLAMHSSSSRLLSCSSDGKVKMWDLQGVPFLSPTFITCFDQPKNEEGVPTSVLFHPHSQTQCICAYSTGNIYVVDVESEEILLSMPHNPDVAGSVAACCLSVHDTLPLLLCGYENKTVRLMDYTTGSILYEMIAHQDAVTSLSFDPTGNYFLSGGHDCSVRLWSMTDHKCVQEITAHTRKYDEAIHSVAFHRSCHLIASAGADGLVKVYV